MQTIANIPSQAQMSLLPPVFSIDDSLGKKLKSVRKEVYRVNMRDMADLLGVPLETYKSWEYDRRPPTGGSKFLIDIAIYRPKVILDLRSGAGNQGSMQVRDEVLEMA